MDQLLRLLGVVAERGQQHGGRHRTAILAVDAENEAVVSGREGSDDGLESLVELLLPLVDHPLQGEAIRRHLRRNRKRNNTPPPNTTPGKSDP